MTLRSEVTAAISDARDRAVASGALSIPDGAALPAIGLAPTGALLEVAADALGLGDFSAEQALELRLARDR